MPDRACPIRLTVDSMTNPIGVDNASPRFSWVLPSESWATQSAYQLEIDEHKVDGTLAPVHRSGWVLSNESSLVRMNDLGLASATQYTWRVRVRFTDGSESAWASASFETSLLSLDSWIATWIEPQQPSVTEEPDIPLEAMLDPEKIAEYMLPVEQRLHPSPMVRQRVELRGAPAVRARLYATAHGCYQPEMNGKSVGDELLAPGYDEHPKRLSFQVYDVTDLLAPSDNVVGFTLSDGFWAGRISFTGTSRNYGDKLQLLWQLHVSYADGSTEIFGSNESARSATGALRYADIFIGEMHDDRLKITGWSTPGFDDSSWEPVAAAGNDYTGLVPFLGEPVRRVTTIDDVQIRTTPRGDTIVDVGQNIAGRIRLKASGPAGTKIVLEHTEALSADGEFQVNILGRNKDQTDVWVLAGHGEEVFEPTFAFHGFQYVRVSGYPGDLDPADVTAVVISSDLSQAGTFHTSDRRINRLHENVVWSQRANYLSIPTDCPQRERAGWAGDTQIFAPAATNNSDVRLFLTRWLQNARAAQLEDGQIPNIIPHTPSFAAMSTSQGTPVSSAGWGDAITMVPWTLYERYGDTDALRDNYEAMKRWVEYCRRDAEDALPDDLKTSPLSPEQRERQQYLRNSAFHFGDWLAPSTMTGGGPEAMFVAPALTGQIVASMFFYHSVSLLARIATILDDPGQAATMTALAEKIRSAFVAEYVSEQGTLTVDMQGPYVLALAFGLIPDDLREPAASQLVRLIRENDTHLDTGFVSIPYLLDVLSDYGHRDLAYQLLFQDTVPSWLYEVDMGATTIWENWAAIATDGTPGPLSLNHYAFGCVDDFLFRHVAGIQNDQTGFRRIRFAPDLTRFASASATRETPHGQASIAWQMDDESVNIEVRVPGNSTAILELPGEESRMLGPGVHTTTLTARAPEMLTAVQR